MVVGTVAGAEPIVNLDHPRRGEMTRLFTGTLAPPTSGTFLRALERASYDRRDMYRC